MTTESDEIEPALDRLSCDSYGTEDKPKTAISDAGLFSLSGGVMRLGSVTSNRLDGLLARMLENPASCKYLGGIDQNLDYLFTSLQLDMIKMIADECSGKSETCEDEPGDFETVHQPVISAD